MTGIFGIAAHRQRCHGTLASKSHEELSAMFRSKDPLSDGDALRVLQGLAPQDTPIVAKNHEDGNPRDRAPNEHIATAGTPPVQMTLHTGRTPMPEMAYGHRAFDRDDEDDDDSDLRPRKRVRTSAPEFSYAEPSIDDDDLY